MQLLYTKTRSENDMKPKPMAAQEILTIIIIGLAAGALSGLVGIGGGIILVPALVYFLHYNQHQAQGTSLGVLTFPVVILAFIAYYRDGQKTGNPIDFRIIALLAIGFIVGAYIGGNAAVKIEKDMLRKIFGVILLFVSLVADGFLPDFQA